MTRSKVLLALFAAILLGGCAQTHKDYSAYRAADPKTILILLPRNSTPEVMATYGFYANTQSPVAESGYYVLPITLVEEHFRTNGMTVADDIHQVPYGRLRDVFGADAALYINVTEYGTKYFIVGSAAVVTAEAKLVDLRTGEQLWTGKASASSEEGNNNQGGGAALLLAALVKQVVGTLSDQSYTVSKMTTVRLLSANSPNALLPGPRSPDYKTK